MLGVQSSFGFRTVKDSGYRDAQGFRDMHTVFGALGFRAFGACRGFRVWGFRVLDFRLWGRGDQGLRFEARLLGLSQCHGTFLIL